MTNHFKQAGRQAGRQADTEQQELPHHATHCPCTVTAAAASPLLALVSLPP